MEDVPVIVAASHFGSNHFANMSTQICIGDTAHVVKLPTGTGAGSTFGFFQFMVLDLRDLSVVDFAGRVAGVAPPQKALERVGKGEFLLIMTTCRMLRDVVPEGKFLEFLEKVGSGPKLERLVRIMTHMDDRPMPPPEPGSPEEKPRGYCYILAATMSVDDGQGIEALSFTDSLVVDFRLQWNDGLKHYLPVQFPNSLEQPA